MAMKMPELLQDIRYKTLPARLEEANNSELYDMISQWTLSLTMEELEAYADRLGFAAHRVSNSQDQYNDAHLRERGAVWEFDDPLYGKVVEYGPGPKLSESPGRMKWIARPVGFHNEHIFRNLLGLDREQMDELEKKKIVGKWDDRVGAKPPDDWNGSDGNFF
jgi:crotonobetainyl-CoA:carnitine CoA-transferase CaiB-like acyl-CoA transferase